MRARGLIALLGEADFEVREAAQAEIEPIAPFCLTFLESQLGQEDPEVALRVQRAIASLAARSRDDLRDRDEVVGRGVRLAGWIDSAMIGIELDRGEVASIHVEGWVAAAVQSAEGEVRVTLAGGIRAIGGWEGGVIRIEGADGIRDISLEGLQRLTVREDGIAEVRSGGETCHGRVTAGSFAFRTAFGTMRFNAADLRGISHRAYPDVGEEIPGVGTVLAVEDFAGHTYVMLHRPGGYEWEACRRIAQEEGGTMVAVRSEEENSFLGELLVRHGRPGEAPCAWLGMTDSGHEGVWTWENGEPSVFSCWRSGEPNNGTGFGIPSEDCCALGKDDYCRGRWNDAMGTSPTPYCLIEFDGGFGKESR